MNSIESIGNKSETGQQLYAAGFTLSANDISDLVIHAVSHFT